MRQARPHNKPEAGAVVSKLGNLRYSRLTEDLGVAVFRTQVWVRLGHVTHMRYSRLLEGLGDAASRTEVWVRLGHVPHQEQ